MASIADRLLHCGEWSEGPDEVEVEVRCMSTNSSAHLLPIAGASRSCSPISRKVRFNIERLTRLSHIAGFGGAGVAKSAKGDFAGADIAKAKKCNRDRRGLQ
jgi:hypothetical protein